MERRDEAAGALARILETARAAWPSVRLEPSVFRDYLEERLPAGADSSAALESLRGSDLYLCCACARMDERAIAAFQIAFFADIEVALRRMARSRDFVDEIAQRLRTKLFVADPSGLPKICEYAGRGDLRSWFRVVVTREALSEVRKAKREESLEDSVLALQACSQADPELTHLRKRCDEAFQTAFQGAVAQLSSHERNLLRHHYVDRLSIDRIGELYRIHRMTAARHLTRVRQQLIDATREILARELDASPSEMRSALHLLRSNVDISIRRVLLDAERPTSSETGR